MLSSCNSWLMFSQKLQEKTKWDFQTIYETLFWPFVFTFHVQCIIWLFCILRQIFSSKALFLTLKSIKIWVWKDCKSSGNTLTNLFPLECHVWFEWFLKKMSSGILIFQFCFLFQQQSSKKDYHLKSTWCLFVEKEFKRQNNLWPKWLSEHWTITPPTPSLSHTHTYSVFHQFRQAKFANGGSI